MERARELRPAGDVWHWASVADTKLVGRTYVWNNTFQYRIFRKFWPEVELNSTFFQDGKNDGQKQNFVTPGLVIGRLSPLEQSWIYYWRRIPDRYDPLPYQQSQCDPVDTVSVLSPPGVFFLHLNTPRYLEPGQLKSPWGVSNRMGTVLTKVTPIFTG